MFYSSLLAYTSNDAQNLLDAEVINSLRSIHEGIIKMESVIATGDKKISFTFKDICKRSGSVGPEPRGDQTNSRKLLQQP